MKQFRKDKRPSLAIAEPLESRLCLSTTLPALRGTGHALIYSARGRHLDVVMSRLNRPRVTACWYDPRNGQRTFVGNFSGNATRRFIPPSVGVGNDWVLILQTSGGLATALSPVPATNLFSDSARIAENVLVEGVDEITP